MAATTTGVGVRFGTLDPDEPYSILGLEPGRPASLRFIMSEEQLLSVRRPTRVTNIYI